VRDGGPKRNPRSDPPEVRCEAKLPQREQRRQVQVTAWLFTPASRKVVTAPVTESVPSAAVVAPVPIRSAPMSALGTKAPLLVRRIQHDVVRVVELARRAVVQVEGTRVGTDTRQLDCLIHLDAILISKRIKSAPQVRTGSPSPCGTG
jgi:hypothetical protein